MNINEAFGNYLKSSDIMGSQPTATISNVTLEKIADDETKPVMYLQGLNKPMVLNKTNSQTISEAYGPETDNWIGKPVTLFVTKTSYGGKMVDAIRVRLPQQQAPQQHYQQPQQPPQQYNQAPQHGGGQQGNYARQQGGYAGQQGQPPQYNTNQPPQQDFEDDVPFKQPHLS